MTTPFPFVASQVLTAAQLNNIQNLPISDKTASYTLLVGDVTKRTIMNSASATTITVDDAIFTVGDVIQVANKGAGVCTITAGAGVTINTSGSLALAQYGGGYLLCLSASTFTFFNLGGGGNSYGTATGGIGAPTAVTIDGVDYEYLTFNSTGTLTVTKAGFFDYLAIGGGGGGMYDSVTSNRGSSGGGAGQVRFGQVYLDANQTITIGAGAAPGTGAAFSGKLVKASDTSIAATSPFVQTASGNVSCEANNGGTGGFVGGGYGSRGSSQSVTITGSTVNGFQGGNGGATDSSAGGGGGNTGAGGNAPSTSQGGAGGAGVDVSVFIGGSELRKAVGGGGGGSSTGGTAATGGVAGTTTTTANSAGANTGSGGGGGYSLPLTGGNGGSGICYIRYEV
jgi:hypothetical protein